jgi:hypothetical protein
MGFLSTARLAALGVVGVIIAGLVIALLIQKHEIRAQAETIWTQRADLERAMQVNDRNVAELDRVKEQSARAVAAVESQLHAAEARRASTAALLKEAHNAPVTRSCIASPAVRAVLGRMREPRAAGADGDPDGQAGDPGRAVGVRPRAGGAGPGERH